MSSRLLSSIWLSLLLLFSQQAAFADTLKHACGSISDSQQQYAFEENPSADDAGRHLFLDHFDGLPSSFFLPVLSGWTSIWTATGTDRVVAAFSRYYSSRAPPLL